MGRYTTRKSSGQRPSLGSIRPSIMNTLRLGSHTSRNSETSASPNGNQVNTATTTFGQRTLKPRKTRLKAASHSSTIMTYSSRQLVRLNQWSPSSETPRATSSTLSMKAKEPRIHIRTPPLSRGRLHRSPEGDNLPDNAGLEGEQVLGN